MAKLDHLKNTLQEFYQKNQQKGRLYIRKHFIVLGFPERSLDRCLTRLEQGETLERKVGSGRPIKIATKETITKLKRLLDHRDGRSQRKVAAKLNCTHNYVGKLLKKYTNIGCFK